MAVLGSFSFVLPVAQADETRIARLVPLTVAGAREIDFCLAALGDAYSWINCPSDSSIKGKNLACNNRYVRH